eukprot:c25221_g2_i1 orf=413-634(+)
MYSGDLFLCQVPDGHDSNLLESVSISHRHREWAFKECWGWQHPPITIPVPCQSIVTGNGHCHSFPSPFPECYV